MKFAIAICFAVLVAITSFSFHSLDAPPGSGCPNIFATVSFPFAEGFTYVTHPTPQTIEFVLPPNSIGRLTVSYQSQSNLTTESFGSPVRAWKVDVSNDSLRLDSGLQVSETNLTKLTPTHYVGNYTLKSAQSDGPFVLDFPSTCLTTIVNVGDKPFNGPFVWLQGVHG